MSDNPPSVRAAERQTWTVFTLAAVMVLILIVGAAAGVYAYHEQGCFNRQLVDLRSVGAANTKAQDDKVRAELEALGHLDKSTVTDYKAALRRYLETRAQLDRARAGIIARTC